MTPAERAVAVGLRALAHVVVEYDPRRREAIQRQACRRIRALLDEHACRHAGEAAALAAAAALGRRA